MRPKPIIALTMGDPAGVGPELCLRALTARVVTEVCVPVVFGDVAVLEACAQATGIKAALRPVLLEALRELDRPAVVEVDGIGVGEFEPGVISAATGRAAFAYVERALDAALAGQVDGVTTAPLNKEALSLAGIAFPGHTEIFAARTQAVRSCMMQYSEIITCTFVTVHVGYAEVPRMVTRERVLEVLELTREGMWRIRGREPRMVVCGLNPHAGEHGLFGDGEEERCIVPAIEAARAQGMQVEGPLPPDTAFLPARRAVTDAFVCMYHDQGHIPLKALAFDQAVNTTLGLPVIRTSVDHGTALDIAWRGMADVGSLYAALRLAAKLAAS